MPAEPQSEQPSQPPAQRPRRILRPPPRPPVPPPKPKPRPKSKPKPEQTASKPKQTAKAKPPSVNEQRQMLVSLSQTAAAFLLGITPRGLRDQSPPRNPDGTYSGPDLLVWATHRNQTEADEMLSGGASAQLERYRAARASMAELELGERQGRLVDVDSLVEWWTSDVAAPIRRAIDAVGKQFGSVAAALVTAALSKAEAAVAAKQPAKEPPCS